jgi:hypothetical protein
MVAAQAVPATDAERAVGAGSRDKEDAERFRWLPTSSWYVGSSGFYCDEAGGLQDYEDSNGSLDDLRAAVDAARGKA